MPDTFTRQAPHKVQQPAGWPRPKGFANGILARGEMVFVGGMIGQASDGRFAEGFVAQMKLALENIAAVLKEAGATPQHIVRLTWYVRSMDEYLAELPKTQTGKLQRFELRRRAAEGASRKLAS